MTDDALHDAIAADATAKALADAGADAACAARMATVLPPAAAQYIPVRTLIYWGGLTGVRARIQSAAASESAIQAVAISYMDMIRDSNSPGLDTLDPAIIGTGGMLDGLTAASVLSASGAGSKADLLSNTPESPVVVPTDQVSRAWARYRPGGKVQV